MKMVTNWFTADAHFDHDNIRAYCNRPYDKVGEMNYDIIRRWNERVKPEDTVFFLGDLGHLRPPNTFEYYRSLLNGDIIFIKGNHDDNNGVKTIIESMVIRHGGIDLWMQHRPVLKYTYNLCAHVHNHWKTWKTKDHIAINVGVDVWDFRPIDIHDILKAISTAELGFHGGDEIEGDSENKSC